MYATNSFIGNNPFIFVKAINCRHTFTPTSESIRISISGTSRFALTNLSLDRDNVDTLISRYEISRGYRYGFQGQEKDDEVKGKGNSYDFGARFHDPRLGRFLSRDPLEVKYPSISPYAFVGNMVTVAIDPDGRDIIFINGYYNTGDGTMPKSIAEDHVGTASHRAYWGKGFVDRAKSYLKDATVQFRDGAGTWNSSGKERYDAGYEYAKAKFGEITANVLDADGVQTETLKFVTHSMGAAYAEGMIKYLEEKGVTVEKVIHFSPADPSDFKASTNPKTIQLDFINDPVLAYKNFDDRSTKGNSIKGVDISATVDGPGQHYAGKMWASSFDRVQDAETIKFSYSHDTKVKRMLPSFGPMPVSYTEKLSIFNATGVNNGTKFSSISFSNRRPLSYSSEGKYSRPKF